MPQEEMSKKLGVGRKTLYRWRQDEEFQTVYQSILDEKLSDIEDCPYAHRVDRINEMFRLYLKVGEKQTSDIKAKIEIIGKIATEAEEGKIDEAADLIVKLRHELANLQGERNDRSERT
jgi:hypothetical protein